MGKHLKFKKVLYRPSPNVCVLYFALQVGHLGGELRLSRLRQLSVQTGRHRLLPALLVFVLKETAAGGKLIQTDCFNSA